LRYDPRPRGGAWVPAGQLVGDLQPPADPPPAILARHAHADPGRARAPAGPRPLRTVVNDVAFTEGAWYAATDEALLVSRDRGETWQAMPFGPLSLPTRSVRVSRDGRRLWAVSLRGMVFSLDAGRTWEWRDLPPDAGGALRLVAADDSTFFAIGERVLYFSWDAGRTWRKAGRGIPQVPVHQIAAVGPAVFAAVQSGGIYVSRDRGESWTRLEGTLAEAFFPAVTASASSDTVYAASSTDGLYAVEWEGLRSGSSSTTGSAPTQPR